VRPGVVAAKNFIPSPSLSNRCSIDCGVTEYMNMDRPANIPVRPGGEARPIVARLVRLDGTEEFLAGRSVRYAGQSHVMVAVGSPAEYFWLRADDVSYTQQG
jgi:hypothetical protein